LEGIGDTGGCIKDVAFAWEFFAYRLDVMYEYLLLMTMLRRKLEETPGGYDSEELLIRIQLKYENSF